MVEQPSWEKDGFIVTPVDADDCNDGLVDALVACLRDSFNREVPDAINPDAINPDATKADAIKPYIRCALEKCNRPGKCEPGWKRSCNVLHKGALSPNPIVAGFMFFLCIGASDDYKIDAVDRETRERAFYWLEDGCINLGFELPPGGKPVDHIYIADTAVIEPYHTVNTFKALLARKTLNEDTESSPAYFKLTPEPVSGIWSSLGFECTIPGSGGTPIASVEYDGGKPRNGAKLKIFLWLKDYKKTTERLEMKGLGSSTFTFYEVRGGKEIRSAKK